MKSYNRSSNIKIALFIIGISTILIIFWINGIIIKDFRKEIKNQVEHLAVAYSNAIHTNEGDAMNILNILLPSINFPIIITFNEEIYAYKNIKINLTESEIDNIDVYDYIEKLNINTNPLPIYWNENVIGKIHYGDPEIIDQLEWLPYFELMFIVIFIFLSLWGFKIIRDSENNFIWVGMARETAHQLGTPISSLFGWVKLLEDQETKQDSILLNMSDDLIRLSQISDRFYKIGIPSNFNEVNIFELFENVKKYVLKRIPNKSNVKILINSTYSENIIKCDKILLEWAFENIIKNSLDACNQDNTIININLEKNKRKIIIIISDNGRGILRKDWKNIFKPGYSTKKRGWGIGLSLSKRIIEDIHKGKINIINSEPRGTKIQLIV